MHRLGPGFFQRYYQLLLPDPNTVVLIAVDAAGRVHGFVAGCRRADAELALLRRHRWRLLVACLGPLLRSPSLAGDLLARLRGMESPELKPWLRHDQPRISYWGWDPHDVAARQSTALLQAFLRTMRQAGAHCVRFEVDRVNRKVELTHRFLGARTLGTLRVSGGRERLWMEHDLESRPV
jgi:hypothetical protein